MSDPSGLFDRERSAIEEAERRLAEGACDAGGFEALLDEYRKLFKTTRRIMRLSDRNERELGAMADRERAAGAESMRKNTELELLSTKLAKYLSPQVYNSIFTGAQDVKVASERKKLTVFFSDITGFSELTDRMESEDLTRLLNQYLTEMSRVALEYGATIDKYIGDAVMIFFGDPETRGVRDDAVACVRMAIAMQERVRELALEWRENGIETQLNCRMGINTGYCTVGNFGSEDRLDYTIIGGAVNVASRLEHEAQAGGILVAYETYAHIRDCIRCEPLGAIQVKGVAYPVSAYRVIDEIGADGVATLDCVSPHFRLSMRLKEMDPEEIREAEAALTRALREIRAS